MSNFAERMEQRGRKQEQKSVLLKKPVDRAKRKLRKYAKERKFKVLP